MKTEKTPGGASERRTLHEKAVEVARRFLKDIDPRLGVVIEGGNEPYLRFTHDSQNFSVENSWTMHLPSDLPDSYWESEFEKSVRQSYRSWMELYKLGMILREKE